MHSLTVVFYIPLYSRDLSPSKESRFTIAVDEGRNVLVESYICLKIVAGVVSRVNH